MIWGTLVFTVAFGVPLVVGSILQCDPATGIFNFNAKVKCFRYLPFFQASAVLHTVTDAWLIVMVIPLLSKLRIPHRQKYAVRGVLGLRVFVVIASIARVATLVYHIDSPDLTWQMADISI
jgi:hypothetical protein